MYKRNRVVREKNLDGKDREAILAGKIKRPMEYEKYKEEAGKVGAQALADDYGSEGAMKFVMDRFNGNRAKIKNYLTNEGSRILSNQLKKKGVLEKELNRVSKQQVRTKTSQVPQSVFAQKLIKELEDQLGIDTNDENFEVRFNSSVGDKMLDYVGGIDCWLEIYDKRQKKVIDYFTIDLTYDPNKGEKNENYHGNKPKAPLNDHVYYYDPSHVHIDGKGNEIIDEDLFNDSDFERLVHITTKEFEPTIISIRSKVGKMVDGTILTLTK